MEADHVEESNENQENYEYSEYSEHSGRSDYAEYDVREEWNLIPCRMPCPVMLRHVTCRTMSRQRE